MKRPIAVVVAVVCSACGPEERTAPSNDASRRVAVAADEVSRVAKATGLTTDEAASRLVEFDLLAARATSLGYDDDREVERVARQSAVQALLIREVERPVDPSEVTESEIAGEEIERTLEAVEPTLANWNGRPWEGGLVKVERIDDRRKDGSLAAAFEDAFFDAPPGSISPHVRTPFGLHVLVIGQERVEAGIVIRRGAHALFPIGETGNAQVVEAARRGADLVARELKTVLARFRAEHRAENVDRIVKRRRAARLAALIERLRSATPIAIDSAAFESTDAIQIAEE